MARKIAPTLILSASLLLGMVSSGHSGTVPAVTAQGGSLARQMHAGPLATLSADRLARRQMAFSFTGVSSAMAERLFAGATAAAYATAGGRLVLLATPEHASLDRLAALLGPAPAATAALRADYQQEMTLADFPSELDRVLPGLREGTFGPYLLRMPIEIDAPPGLAVDGQAGNPPAAPSATVFSEDFEAGIRSSVWQLQSPAGQAGWGATSCEGPGTGKSADAVRGPTTTLNCTDVYPANQLNWMVHKNCENFSGAAKAWLQFAIAVWTTNSQADSLSVVFLNPTGTRYIGFWHGGNWRPKWSFYYNLKQWEGIGDLTAYACNHLGFIFMSDNNVDPPAPGFGARVDDILIYTGSDPPITCSVSADTTWGAAPLTVHFTGTAAGGSGRTYVWNFNDGATSTSQSPTHTFNYVGEYDPWFEVLTPTGEKCLASLHVTAHGGGDDLCSGATEIVVNQGYTFSTEGYTRDQGVTATPCSTEDGATGATRWLQLTPTKPGYGVVKLCGSDENPFVTLFKGACNALTWLHCYDTDATCGVTPPPTVAMQPGETFSFQVARLDDVGADTHFVVEFAECTVGCTATVPATGSIGAAVSFFSTVSPSHCPLTAATYAWTFGDGTPGSTVGNPTHTYTTAGPKSWSLAVTVNGVTCTKSGTITISALPPGDANGDGIVNVADIFYLINTLFAGGPNPVGSGDVNHDGVVNVQDVFYLINYLFAGGPPPS